MSLQMLYLLLAALIASSPALGENSSLGVSDYSLKDDSNLTQVSNISGLANVLNPNNASVSANFSLSNQTAQEKALGQEIPDSLAKRLDNTSQNQTAFDTASHSELLKYGNILAGYGYYNFSLLYYNRSLELDPSVAEAWNNKGTAMAFLGRQGSAIEAYDRAIALEPQNSIVLSNKATALHSTGQSADALALLDKALDLDPKNADAWNDKGVMLAEMGRDSEALDCFNSSISSDLYYAKAYNNKGVVLARMGRLDDGLTAMRSGAIILNENYPVAWYNGALVQRDLGNMDSYEEAMERAEALGYNTTFSYLAHNSTSINSTSGNSTSGRDDYVLDLEPTFMGAEEKPVEEAPGFEEGLAVACLALAFMVRRWSGRF